MSSDITSVAIGSLRLHADAERVPLADHADLRALRESLAENGQQDPIDVTEEGVILDGRTRWKLLTELGAESILVRVQYVPEDHQTHWIVDRALTRRHLTMAQKKVLSDLLRALVVEVDTHPKTGEERRIGMGQSQRAAELGVNRDSIKRWDRENAGGVNTPPTPGPTHYREEGRGRVMPIHPDRRPAEPKARSAPAARPRQNSTPRPVRHAPPWMRHMTIWCRGVLPEDHTYVLHMSGELHEAMSRLGLSCAEGERNQS